MSEIEDAADTQHEFSRQIADRQITTDKDGFINDPFAWSEEVAVFFARESGIEQLTEKQWRVIRFIREYYVAQGKAPLNHKIKKGTGLSLLEIGSLFPGGISQGAFRLAGLPKAKTCTG